MIILHPDDVLLLDQRIKAVRELLVDAFITAAELILIFRKIDAVVKERPQGAVGIARSEEPTSELQSLMRISYAVFCLKKKNTSKLTSRNTNSHPVYRTHKKKNSI